MNKVDYETKIKNFKTQSSRDLTKDVKKIIRYACDVNIKTNFKMNLTIKELLDMKKYNNTELLITYVSAIDNISDIMKIKYPYIDLTGIDLTWTTEDIVKFVKKVNLKLPIYKVEDFK